MTHPLLLEINTRCWLAECSDNRDAPATLSEVPSRILDDWADLGVTHLWLMGVWTTGPLSRDRALSHTGLRREFDRALPEWQPGDVAGSPYAIQSLEVPGALGGRVGLEDFRRRLHMRGMRLILDFVPNHVGLDHPWIREHPGYFVRCPAGHPQGFASDGQTSDADWIAHGKDPYFPPWDDTAQLDYRCADVHKAMHEELAKIAGLCDGVRCDMAMLVLPDVFDRTWKEFPGACAAAPDRRGDFWSDAIRSVRAVHTDFLFLAEVYWGMERRLQELGFDYTYDKALTDLLLDGRGMEVVRHLRSAPPSFLRRGAHFLENHDERRVADVLGLDAHRAAALAVLGLPGMRFLHDGQLAGAVVRVPVQLRRCAKERVDPAVRDLYLTILAALRDSGAGRGEGEVLATRPAWADNPSWENLLVIRWGDNAARFTLVVVNLSDEPSQCRVPLAVPGSDRREWQLVDRLGDERWTRSAAELRDPGLFLDLASHAGQVFVVDAVPASEPHSS